MPEEINRVLTDCLSDLLFVTEPAAIENLAKEGIDSDRVHFVGNVMIDTLMANRQKAQKSQILSRLGLSAGNYAVITLHRPSNVDDLKKLGEIIDAFEKLEKQLKLVFPVHPRTRDNISNSPLEKRVKAMSNLLLIEPAGYLDFLCLMSSAAFVMTDSGGIQEETTILGVPCMTLRDNTERPVTITEGTNRLVKATSSDILENYRRIKMMGPGKAAMPRFWDGRAAERIADIIAAQAGAL